MTGSPKNKKHRQVMRDASAFQACESCGFVGQAVMLAGLESGGRNWFQPAYFENPVSIAGLFR